nr:immunoglobulin heavy chain junction region [Mus musculus]MBK4185293.1 immunoglobulin heavy chain junction region [Mus musculus]
CARWGDVGCAMDYW